MGALVFASLFLVGLTTLTTGLQDIDKQASGLVYIAKGLPVPLEYDSAAPTNIEQQQQPLSTRRYHYEPEAAVEPYITYSAPAYDYQGHSEENYSNGGEEVDREQFLGDLGGYNHYKSSHSFNLEGPRQIETIHTNSYHKEVDPYDTAIFSDQKHNEDEEHAEVHYHQHKHLHKHNHKQEHVHKHKQEHKHHHGHKHQHHSDHEHKHEQKHEHHQIAKHEHDHKAEHNHKHDHHHGHKHHADHKHEHKHHQEHKHKHNHGHKHEHQAHHKHEHKQEHKHEHKHGHKHHEDHKHKHSHHNHHKHGHHQYHQHHKYH